MYIYIYIYIADDDAGGPYARRGNGCDPAWDCRCAS